MSTNAFKPWHFTQRPGSGSVEQLRERRSLPDMPEKFEILEGKLFWSDTLRFHVLCILIETLGTEAVETFIAEHRAG